MPDCAATYAAAVISKPSTIVDTRYQYLRFIASLLSAPNALLIVEIFKPLDSLGLYSFWQTKCPPGLEHGLDPM